MGDRETQHPRPGRAQLDSMTLPGMDTAALRRFLVDSGAPVSGALVIEPISGGRSNLTFRAYDDVSTWVVRRPPTSGRTPSAHDMAREFTVTGALSSTAVPVASAAAFDAEGGTLGVLTDMETLSAALTAEVPMSSPAAIVHGDFRIDNAILGQDRPDIVRAIVDWDMPTLAPSLDWTSVTTRSPHQRRHQSFWPPASAR